eukprot:6201447-Pleurochrysis_carterae.AAC.1
MRRACGTWVDSATVSAALCALARSAGPFPHSFSRGFPRFKRLGSRVLRSRVPFLCSTLHACMLVVSMKSRAQRADFTECSEMCRRKDEHDACFGSTSWLPSSVTI